MELQCPPNISLEPYKQEDNIACIELERNCPQGKKFPVYIERSEFHARAAEFADYQIDVLKHKSKVIGVISTALRDVIINGKSRKLGYAFDKRLHPEFRGRGLGTLLVKATMKSSAKMGAELTYGVVSNENPDLQRESMYNQIGSFKFLSLPVYKKYSSFEDWEDCTLRENHGMTCTCNGPFDFYTTPFEENRLPRGFAKSLRNDHSGCSIWDGKELGQHIIVKTPRWYGMLRHFLKLCPTDLRNLHMLSQGEHIREWTIFDFWASSGPNAMNLARHINNLAMEKGVNFINYLISVKFAYERELCSINRTVPTEVVPFTVVEVGSKKLHPCINLYADVRD